MSLEKSIPLTLNALGNGAVNAIPASQENYYAQNGASVLISEFPSGDSAYYGALSTVSTNSSIGSYTDTFYNEPVGTHPGSSLSIGSTTTTLYQNKGDSVDAFAEWHRTVAADSSGDIYEMDSDSFYRWGHRLLENALTGEQAGGFRIGTTSAGLPSGYSLYKSNIFSDNITSGSTTYNLYRRTLNTSIYFPPTYYTLQLKDSDAHHIKEMQGTTAVRSAYFAMRHAEQNSGLGDYLLLSDSDGSPTDLGYTGTWVARGVALDTRHQTQIKQYLGTFTTQFTGQYTGNFTGQYTGVSYGRFSDVYAGERRYQSVVGQYARDYAGVYAGSRTYTVAKFAANPAAPNVGFTATYLEGGQYGGSRNYNGQYGGSRIYAGQYGGERAYGPTQFGGNRVVDVVTYGSNNYTGQYGGSRNYVSVVGEYAGVANYTGQYGGSRNYASVVGQYQGQATYSDNYEGQRFFSGVRTVLAPYADQYTNQYVTVTQQFSGQRQVQYDGSRPGPTVYSSVTFYEHPGKYGTPAQFTTNYAGVANYQGTTQYTDKYTLENFVGFNYSSAQTFSSATFAGVAIYEGAVTPYGVTNFYEGVANYTGQYTGIFRPPKVLPGQPPLPQQLQFEGTRVVTAQYSGERQRLTNVPIIRVEGPSFFSGSVTVAENFAGSRNYTGQYGGSRPGPAVYSGDRTYDGQYAGSRTYAAQFFTAIASGPGYLGTRTVAGQFTGQRTYAGQYAGEREYSGVYSGVRAYEASYAGSRNYTGQYGGFRTLYWAGFRDYSASYSGFRDKVFTAQYSGTYSTQFTGQYTGSFSSNFDGETIISATETIHTYTLYCRISET